jgi:hypothetical protein
MSRVFVYPHVETTTKGRQEFTLGIDEFRDYFGRYLMSEYFSEYRCGKPTAGVGDLIVLAFKDGSEWFLVGDGLVVSKWHDTEDKEYPWSYRLSGVRLYPRSVAFKELGKRGSELRRKIQIAPQLSPDEYLEMLSRSATPR